METEDFERAVRHMRELDPVLFTLPSEEPMSSRDLAQAEARFAVALPNKLKWFMSEYGAGQFGLAVIYSLVSEGQGSVAFASKLPWLEGRGLFPVSDNGVGDYYCLVVNSDGQASEEVCLLDHETDSISERVYSDFLEFVADIGLDHGWPARLI